MGGLQQEDDGLGGSQQEDDDGLILALQLLLWFSFELDSVFGLLERPVSFWTNAMKSRGLVWIILGEWV